MKDKYYHLKEILGVLNERLADESSDFLLPDQLLTAASRCMDETPGTEEKEILRNFLNLSSRTEVLTKLSEEQRYFWAEIVFKIIRLIDFKLLDLFRSRNDQNPQKPLFIEVFGERKKEHSYSEVNLLTKKLAALIYKLYSKNTKSREYPKVGIFCDNSYKGALIDLACLFYDITVIPLNIHFKEDELTNIFGRANVDYLFIDSEQRLEIAHRTIKENDLLTEVILIDSEIRDKVPHGVFLDDLMTEFHDSEIELILSRRIKKKLNQVCTIMFTSGSTGMPKGVCYTQYNLVTKRFARAAALPQVGKDELMICYLPLFHTFGRFLEMLGMIFWNGTYVFVGEATPDSLFQLFKKLNPTGFISVPIRWEQLYEKCSGKMSVSFNEQNQKMIFRSIVGDNLRWGLSAAGYLNPKNFRFFQQFGVDLCSGFGMTEGTGGLTMTPPGNYKENSIGKALPGTYTRLSEIGELSVSGHYIARYIEEVGENGVIPFPENDENDYWMPTGDIFTQDEGGHFEIIDRIKDIYKNSKGQTVAPQTVENKFKGVPGIKRTFLVGDGKPYNVLFIVPDEEEPIVKNSIDRYILREYFRQIVNVANRELAPYERVVNYEILERDFSEKLYEITSKGSLNRKVIEKNFLETIEKLYQKNSIDLVVGDITITIPRWFYRDLGILEDEIVFENEKLINRQNGKQLTFRQTEDNMHIRVGDLIYHMKQLHINLGVFAHQPRLWVSNPELIFFAPCKEGWDNLVDYEFTRVHLPENVKYEFPDNKVPQPSKFRDRQLLSINNLMTTALFADDDSSLYSLHKLEELLAKSDDRTASVIRIRLEALATHNSEKIRCLAYKILLLDEPTVIYNRAFPAFLYSGLTFLNEESMKEIALGKLEKQRLESLRQRLFIYRNELHFPIEENVRKQFENIFRLLVNFASNYIEFYGSVRAELVSWMLLQNDERLAAVALDQFFKLSEVYESKLEESSTEMDDYFWSTVILFDEDIDETERIQIIDIITDRIFLKQSIILAFDDVNFSLSDIIPGGVLVGRITGAYHQKRYRISINTKNDNHYDLELQMFENIKEETSVKTALWHIAIAGYSYDSLILPQMGCYKPGISAGSSVYIGDLTVWDKIRSNAYVKVPRGTIKAEIKWKNLYVKALSAFFTAWRNSCYKIVPGIIAPSNVVVPENDFFEKATILTLTGWKSFQKNEDLIAPMLENFYNKVTAQYPWIKNEIEVSWIFDSCMESLGIDEGKAFLIKLRNEQLSDRLKFAGLSLYDLLIDYLDKLELNCYYPLPLHNAIHRYNQWEQTNIGADSSAREQSVFELFGLYRLDRFSEIVRYEFYRLTYFKNIDTAASVAFEELMLKLNTHKVRPAIEFPELPDLQTELFKQNTAKNINQSDQRVFSKMVFPKFKTKNLPEIHLLTHSEDRHVFVQTYITDKNNNQYSVRPPVNPVEIGELYRLFFRDNFPHETSSIDNYLLVFDLQQRCVAGMTYKLNEYNEALIDGIVVTNSLKGRSIGTALIYDFFSRMSSNGVKIIRTYFLLRDFYLSCGFRTDKRYGALVKFLDERKRDLELEPAE